MSNDGGEGHVPPLRVRAGRRAQELLPGGQRGRARDVGARRRPAGVRRAPRFDRTERARGDDRRRRRGADDPRARHRDVVRRDRRRGRGGRTLRPLLGGVEPGRSPRALRWCGARGREPRPRGADHPGDRRGAGGSGRRADRPRRGRGVPRARPRRRAARRGERGEGDRARRRSSLRGREPPRSPPACRVVGRARSRTAARGADRQSVGTP